MGMDPGLEFKVALEEADKLNARYVALHTFHCSPLLVSCKALLLCKPCIAVATASPSQINETRAHIRANLLEQGVFRYCQP